jgi:hypothetical protein
LGVPFSLSFLALGPRIRVDSNLIETRTGWIVGTLTLGSWLDATEVDSRSRRVTIRRRRFWFHRSTRTIRFEDVQHVAYSLITGTSLLGDERGYGEQFDVALTLHTGEEVPLCRFSGNGEFVADVSLLHEWIGDRIREATDVRGNQQETSVGFVDLICSRIGVPIGPSRYF